LFNALLMVLVSCFFIIYSGIAHSSHPAAAHPFKISQFKVSKENIGLYGDYRSKWLRMSGFELSTLHWNQFVAIFVNQSSDVYRANYIEYLRTSQDDYDEVDEEEDEKGNVISKYKKYPPGTMLAKEGFNSHQGKPGDPTFLVIMKKHEAGYDTANGNWEYMQFAVDGTSLLRGKGSDPAVMKLCAGCHTNVADRDYVFSSFFSGIASH
jgi:hypothetical protein